MESIFVPEVAEQAAEPAAPTEPAPVPALIFLDSADDAAVCDVDGTCP